MAILLISLLTAPQGTDGACMDCHRDTRDGLSPVHAFLTQDCTRCHAGHDEATPGGTDRFEHRTKRSIPGRIRPGPDGAIEQ